MRRPKIFPILSSSVEGTFNTTTMEALLAQKGDLGISAGGGLVRLLQGGKREIVWDGNSELLCPYIAKRHLPDTALTCPPPPGK